MVVHRNIILHTGHNCRQKFSFVDTRITSNRYRESKTQKKEKRRRTNRRQEANEHREKKKVETQNRSPYPECIKTPNKYSKIRKIQVDCGVSTRETEKKEVEKEVKSRESK
jgi:hypothetical protein